MARWLSRNRCALTLLKILISMGLNSVAHLALFLKYLVSLDDEKYGRDGDGKNEGIERHREALRGEKFSPVKGGPPITSNLTSNLTSKLRGEMESKKKRQKKYPQKGV